MRFFFEHLDITCDRLCVGKTPEERAELLETTPLFASIHAETANTGQTAPTAETNFHFTCFVQAPEQDFRKVARQEAVSESAMAEPTSGMRLIELDGRRRGPIDRGECTDLLIVGPSDFSFLLDS